MKKRKLGKTNLQLTELGFGGASIGNLYYAISNREAEKTLDTAWQRGIRYYDTAPQYGSGLSEHRLGYVLREHPRDEFVLSTKVGKLLTPTQETIKPDEQWFVNSLPNKVSYDYGYDGIKRSIEDSLHRLGMNVIDIAHIHDLDNIVLGEEFPRYFKQAMDSGYKALAELKQQGIIKAISLGVKEWRVCAEALKYGEFDCFMLQDNYTLLEQNALEFLDECLKKNISILLASPFGSGILVKGAVSGARYKYVTASDAIINRAKKLEAICAEYQVKLPAAALQFPLRHPAIASVVTGIRTEEQAKKNIAWLIDKIPEEFWEGLKKEKLIPENSP